MGPVTQRSEVDDIGTLAVEKSLEKQLSGRLDCQISGSGFISVSHGVLIRGVVFRR